MEWLGRWIVDSGYIVYVPDRSEDGSYSVFQCLFLILAISCVLLGSSGINLGYIISGTIKWRNFTCGCGGR